MKTIVRNEDNISLFYFDDDTEIVVGKETKIIKDGEEILTIADSEPEGVTIYTEVDAVPDWYGWKYFYDGSNWTVNEDFKGRTDIVLGIDNATTDITVRYPNALHSSGSIQINDVYSRFRYVHSRCLLLHGLRWLQKEYHRTRARLVCDGWEARIFYHRPRTILRRLIDS